MPHTTPRTYGSLVDRYVHAATRSLPEDQRDDVADELRASIADRVESLRLEQPGLDEEEAERTAVAELGDPDRLAAEYAGRPLYVVGPGLYPAWTRTLRTLLLVVLPIVVAVDVIAGVALEEKGFGDLVGSAVVTLLQVGVHIAFWTTLVFFIMERTLTPEQATESTGGPWTPDKLPDLPRDRTSLNELIAGTVFAVLIGAALVAQHVLSPVRENGERIPVLDPDLWSFWLPLILALLVVEIGFQVVVHRVGWTTQLAVANVVLGTLSSAPWVFLAATDRLFNPAAVTALQREVDVDPGMAGKVVIATAVLIWLWDSVDGFRRARGARTGC